jgi:5-methylcytosine-specific restriction endonuclease McrBC regulatory subunit McrC
MKLRTKDNSQKKLEHAGPSDIESLWKIASRDIGQLKLDNDGALLVFPDDWKAGIEGSGGRRPLFTLTKDGTITTNNIMGFIGIDKTELTISSRFASDEKGGHDYFLHYMLQKVLSFNIVNLDLSSAKESVADFLPYLFPGLLREALSQGIYRQYHRREYNDANLRGAIDTARHLRTNMPFMYKVAYSTREHTADNAVTQLIRHTIEYIAARPIGNAVLANSPDARMDVSTIKSVTRNYQKNERQKIINANRKTFNHPYFTKYRRLQQLCLQILNHEKITSGGENDKVHGILFDGSWLWEEYLNTLLKHRFTHPNNRTGYGREYLFYNDKDNYEQEIYPDFISNDKTIIADAKYKELEVKNREDYFQIIAYMHRFKSEDGFLLFPEKNHVQKNYTVIGTSDKLTKLGLAIPTQSENFKLFRNQIEENERFFYDRLKDANITKGEKQHG